jgi:hypothetical protein
MSKNKKTDKLDFIKIKNFCVKGYYEAWKDNRQNGREYLQIIYSVRV